MSEISEISEQFPLDIGPEKGLEILRETAKEHGLDSAGSSLGSGEPVDRTLGRDRLAQAAAMFQSDMAAIAADLDKLCRTGNSPATESATHLLNAGGKRVRPLLVLLSCSCFRTVTAEARNLAVVAELIHLATLLHDDVIDDGQERRGQPTSRRVWGNAVSVLAGDLLLTHALERTATVASTSSTGSTNVLRELIATLRRLVDGEVVQLRGRSRLDVDESVYFDIIRDKTASLFVWAARSGASVAGASRAHVEMLGEFGLRLGTAFQLVDDVLDYAGETEQTGKLVFADLQEGKLTLPLIRAILASPKLHGELEKVRIGDSEAANRLAASVKQSGVCNGVRDLAQSETRRALEALASLPESTAREMLGAVALGLSARLF